MTDNRPQWIKDKMREHSIRVVPGHWPNFPPDDDEGWEGWWAIVSAMSIRGREAKAEWETRQSASRGTPTITIYPELNAQIVKLLPPQHE